MIEQPDQVPAVEANQKPDQVPAVQAKGNGDEPLALILGIVVWVAISVLLAVVEVFLLPWTTKGSVHIPVSMILVVLANLLLPRVFVWGLGIRWGWAVPAAVWFVVMLVAAARTSDGDLLIVSTNFSGTYNIIFLALGGLAALVGCISVTRPPRRKSVQTTDQRADGAIR